MFPVTCISTSRTDLWVQCVCEGKKLLTCFPEATQRPQGRWTSQLRCAFLQLTHAEATCALVLLAGFAGLAGGGAIIAGCWTMGP